MIGVTDIVYISFHETYYCLYPASGGQVLRVSATGLNRLGNEIASLDTGNSHRYTNVKEHLETEVTKMSKMQKIWDEAHPVTKGQILPAGTEVIEAKYISGINVSGFTIAPLASTLPVGNHAEDSLRTLEPLPDPDDTGDADFYVYTRGIAGDTVDIGDVVVTRNQALNFARKLLEALDGH